MTPRPPCVDLEGVRWSSYNNTSFIDAFVHTGTHIDTAYHVSADGLRLGSFGITDFVFEKPTVLEIPKSDEEEIMREDLEPHEERLRETDLLLVYTGFSDYRAGDPERYTMKQPGFSARAAEYLVGMPRMRCVGGDFMGIENIPNGRASDPPFPAHRAFLLSGKKFLILEDPDVRPLLGKTLRRAYVVPLLFPEAEAMMVTAFAETD
jgi:kynurenine formamidase